MKDTARIVVVWMLLMAALYFGYVALQVHTWLVSMKWSALVFACFSGMWLLTRSMARNPSANPRGQTLGETIFVAAGMFFLGALQLYSCRNLKFLTQQSKLALLLSAVIPFVVAVIKVCEAVKKWRTASRESATQADSV